MGQNELIIVIGLIGSGLLLAASAFFSASETALVSLSAQKAKHLALKNPRVSHALVGWLRRPHDLLTLILVGNTFATVMFAASLTAVAVHVFSAYSPSLVRWITWGLETAVIVIFGDMAPKFFARANPEKTSLMVLPWLSRLRLFLGPLFSVSFIFGFLFPKWKSPPVGEMLTFSMEDLKSLLEEGQPDAGGTDSSVDMMQRVLEINDRKAKSIMTPIQNVDLIEIDPKGKHPRDRALLIDLIIEEGHTRTPVKKGGEIIGFIHSDDLLPLIIQDNGRDLTSMVRTAMDVPSERLVSDLLQDFRSSGVYAGFVRDDKNIILGLVTLEDVLEEITGEILDEYDVSAPNMGTAS